MSRYGPVFDTIEAEPEHVSDLRRVVNEFDVLMNNCWDATLTAEESKTLNELYGMLNLMEQSYWEGVSDRSFALVQSRLDADFPMIRHILGMLSPTPSE